MPSTSRAEYAVSKCGSSHLSTSAFTFDGSLRYASRLASRSFSIPSADACTSLPGSSAATGAGAVPVAGVGCRIGRERHARTGEQRHENGRVDERFLQRLHFCFSLVASSDDADESEEPESPPPPPFWAKLAKNLFTRLSSTMADCVNGNRAAILQEHVRAAGTDADVLAAQQALGLDARIAVVRRSGCTHC